MTPTPEQLAKLPKWAQEHMKDLERDADKYKEVARHFMEAQTPTPFYTELWDVEMGKRVYIKTENATICAEYAGCKVSLFLARKDDVQRPYGIEIKMEELNRRGMSQNVVFLPNSIGTIFIMHKDNL